MLAGGLACAPATEPDVGTPRADGVSAEALERATYVGFRGTGSGRFVRPRTLACGGGHVFVIDKTGRVQRFDARTLERTLMWHVPFDNERPTAAPDVASLEPGRLPDGTPMEPSTGRLARGYPVGCTIDPTTDPPTLIVVHTHYQQVLRYSLDGALLSEFGQQGDGDGEFMYPARVAVDNRTRELFITEYGRGAHHIQAFSADGEFQRRFAGEGTEEGRFIRPNGICIAPASSVVIGAPATTTASEAATGAPPSAIGATARSVYVCDAGNDRIQEFTLDGRFVRGFGEQGDAPGQLRTPFGITYDAARDRLIVAEYEAARLAIFTRAGACVGTFGQLGRGAGEFQRVWDVALDPATDRLFVPDYLNHRLVVIPADIVPGLGPLPGAD